MQVVLMQATLRSGLVLGHSGLPANPVSRSLLTTLTTLVGLAAELTESMQKLGALAEDPKAKVKELVSKNAARSDCALATGDVLVARRPPPSRTCKLSS